MDQCTKSSIRFNPKKQSHHSIKSLKPKLLTLAIVQALAFQAAKAASIEVTSNLDDGTDCTLREAIASVNAGSDQSNGCVIDTGADPLGTNDTINMAAGVAGSTITLGGTELTPTKSVTINGENITVDANNTSRVMNLYRLQSAAYFSVTLNHLTLSGGNSIDNGGGIYAGFVGLTLVDSTITGNTAGNDGGGIHASNFIPLTLTNSTVSGNTATNSGGGIWAARGFRYVNIGSFPMLDLNNSTVSDNTAQYGGGIYGGWPTILKVNNSTVSGNTATASGGGIHSISAEIDLTNSTISENRGSVTGGGVFATNVGFTRLTNSTLSGNYATISGGGISADRFTDIPLINSIVAHNYTSGVPADDCFVYGEPSSVFEASADTITTSSCDGATIADPLLGPLANNGGSTQTHELLADSPAIDNATGIIATAADQRGFAAVGTRDSGAYEFGVFDPSDFVPVTSVNNRWTMVGLSKDAPSKTVQDVFGSVGLLPGDYNNKWVVYRYDESTETSIRMALTDTMEQDKGYWMVQNTGSDLEFAPDGTVTPADTSDPNCPSDSGCFEIDLAEGDGKFNLISHPFTADVKWQDIRVVVDGVVDCHYNHVADTFWNYNGTSYDSFSSTFPPSDGGVFEAYKGYWVQTLAPSVGADVKLLVPFGPVSEPCAPPAVSSVKAQTEEQIADSNEAEELPWWLSWISVSQAAEDTSLKHGEWWVRLQAESTEDGGMVDQYNYLGWYQDSDDGKDRRDLKELPPFSTPYLTLVFRHDDWVDHPGDYSTDLRKTKYWREGEEWAFIIKSDKIGREVTLSWEGYYKVRRFWRMRLVDMESGKTLRTLSRGQLQTYTFTTQRTEHRFKWVFLERPQ